MRISILGAGNGGTAVAADLSLKGHEVTLVKTSNSMHNVNFDYLVDNGGRVKMIEGGEEREAHIAQVTRDLTKITDSEVVIVYIQTTYHEDLIKRIIPYLKDDQILLFNPGYFSTAYVLKHLKDKRPIIVEAQSSFIDCRIIEPGVVRVGFRNVRNPLGIYPSDRKEEARSILERVGFPFTYLDSIVEAAIHNPNLIVHTVGAIMSIPRIEKTKGDYVMYHEVFTPSVWNILEALDSEKMDVLEKLGFERIPYVEACKHRNSLDDERDAKEVFFWYAAMPTRAKGPTTVNSRYITEDVPQGLVLLETLGAELDVPTPVCSSLIEIATAALGRDMRENGRTVSRLGKENIKRILKDGAEGGKNEQKG
ncbi:MAG: NAD/NADP octopine/nopaline dehydrogenase [Clostridiales bacterium]|nr:NAD/NADP octopine/nopaline dehydrogenase [Clostridiales bacterium]